MDPKTDKLVRRTTMIATVTASYFLLTADYGPEPNFLDPTGLGDYPQMERIKNAILSAERSVKEFVFGPKQKSQKTLESETSKLPSGPPEKHP